VEAVRRIIADGIAADQIDEEMISRYLYTAHIPDPDLVIRTAGEMRLSNFLLWQAAYSEYYATPTLWPDFGEADLHRAIEAYASRHRKFGKL
jgi:undecaprenyl diphosphate synthase